MITRTCVALAVMTFTAWPSSTLIDDGHAILSALRTQERDKTNDFAIGYTLYAFPAKDFMGDDTTWAKEDARETIQGLVVESLTEWGLKMLIPGPVGNNSTSGNESPANLPPGEVVGWWNGEFWIERLPLRAQAEIKRQPPSAPELDILGPFFGIDAPTFVGRWSILDLIDSTEIVTIERITEPYPGVRAQLRDPTVPTVRVTLDVVEVDNRYWVSLLDYEVFSVDGVPVARIDYRVEDWQVLEGKTTPSRAIRDGILYSSAPVIEQSIGRISRVQIERNQNANPPFDTSATLTAAVQLQDGDFVSDETLGIRYQIGGDMIGLDGFPLQLSEPVSSRVAADSLAAILGEKVIGPAERPVNSTRIVLPIPTLALLAIATGAFVVIATTIVRRRSS